MSKRKSVDGQLSFSDYLPISWDYGLEAEVFKETGKRSLPDANPYYLDYLHNYLDAWLIAHPDSNIYAIRDSYDFRNF